MGRPHPAAAEFLRARGLDPEAHTRSAAVPVVSLGDLLLEVGGCRVGVLKTDVEGGDARLLMAYARFLAAHPECHADRIQVRTGG